MDSHKAEKRAELVAMKAWENVAPSPPARQATLLWAAFIVVGVMWVYVLGRLVW